MSSAQYQAMCVSVSAAADSRAWDMEELWAAFKANVNRGAGWDLGQMAALLAYRRCHFSPQLREGLTPAKAAEELFVGIAQLCQGGERFQVGGTALPREMMSDDEHRFLQQWQSCEPRTALCQ